MIITEIETGMGKGNVLIVRITTRVDQDGMMTVNAIGTETGSTETIGAEMIVNVILSGIGIGETRIRKETERRIETGIDAGKEQKRGKPRRKKRVRVPTKLHSVSCIPTYLYPPLRVEATMVCR